MFTPSTFSLLNIRWVSPELFTERVLLELVNILDLIWVDPSGDCRGSHLSGDIDLSTSLRYCF